MSKPASRVAIRLRPLGLIVVIAFGLLTTLATGGSGGGGGSAASPEPGTIQLLETTFDATEGTVVNVRVARSGGNFGAVSVDYSTADGSAQAGSDYTAASGTLTWPDGVSGNRTISIPINDDDLVEPPESFLVTLSGVARARLGSNASANINIINNDAGIAQLNELSLSAGTLDPIFQPTFTEYTAAASVLVSEITVQATAEEIGASITVNGIDMPSGEFSDRIPLNLGSTTIDVSVTSIDEITTETYTIDFDRRAFVAFAQKLTAGDADEDDQFGRSLALDGATAIVGALRDDDLGQDSGSAYVFRRSDGNWTEQQKLLASDGMPGDGFGQSVALEDDMVVVVAAGVAYAFSRTGGVWAEQQKFGASDGGLFNNVVLDGDTAVFGALGSVYVFEYIAGLWMERQKLTASDGTLFGNAVALDGDTLVIGYSNDNISCFGSGSAYVFQQTNGVWVEQTKLIPNDPRGNSRFGGSLAIEGDTIVIGAYGNSHSQPPVPIDCDLDFPSLEGAAYVFVRNGNAWEERQKLVASDAEEDDEFGSGVALQDDVLVVSANDIVANFPVSVGYVFVRHAGKWTEQHKLIPADAPAFSFSQFPEVALDEGYLLLGSWAAVNSGTLSGSVLVFGGL